MPEIDKPFSEYHEAPRGSKFKIGRESTGLYFIQMENGGVPPAMCEQKYTSLRLARETIQKYSDAHPKVTPRPKKPKLKED